MRTILSILTALYLTIMSAASQDTLYIYKGGAVAFKSVITNVDSITFKEAKNVIVDYDGNVYHTVTIGTQTWLIENLKTTHYRNGDLITNITANGSWSDATAGAWCDFDNNNANGITYGHLYNGYAVLDTRKIAPEGWHVATDAELTTLETYLIANGYNYDGSITNDKIAKSLASTNLWTATTTVEGAIGNDLSKNNSTGFTALPGGHRSANGLFSSLYNYGYWWTATENGNSMYGRHLISVNYSITKSTYSKPLGFSVRCVKN
ncbi:MAG TPA: fibrobacter succinogenes major paralogous domain-containing protein [Paludibacter sp.]|nr:fibrobacter succinogenes major paralogous domain-containing protein [Paludibacter sp.]